jgi:hypothetical protein
MGIKNMPRYMPAFMTRVKVSCDPTIVQILDNTMIGSAIFQLSMK